MSISPQQVQQLREKSGAGIMDCKRALESTSGEFEKAIQFLREKGKATAAQKSGRSTKQGLVCSWIDSDARHGSILEINCETDFVARTKEFQDLAVHLTEQSGKSSMNGVEQLLSSKSGSSESVEALLKEKISKLGENIQIKKVSSMGGEGATLVGNYVHSPVQDSPQCGVLAVLLEVKAEKSSPEVHQLIRELCMQIAATAPRWISKDHVPQEIVEKEKEIYKEQCKQSGKPEKAWGRIIEGKLADFYRQFCLMDQPSVRDSSGKNPVRSLLQATAEKTSQTLTIQNFVRYKKGEE